MTERIEALQREIREIDALIERCRRSAPSDTEARFALAMLEACREERVRRLQRALH